MVGGTVRGIVTSEIKESFEHHPGLRGRQPEAYDMAEELRRLIALSVTSAPSPEETAELTAQLAAVADRLEELLPAEPFPRFCAPPPDAPAPEAPLGGSMPFDPIVGRFNPLAVPVTLSFDPPKAFGHAVFTVAYEGAPGCVHGSALAATFDLVLTAANAVAGATGPTVRLNTRFRRPTLLNEDVLFEGWVTEVTERRVFSLGRIVQRGEVTVEAEGEFAIFNLGKVQELAAAARGNTAGPPASR
jgi:acyl-coenzyme A thioesterase PaaI-like protein